MDKEQLLDKFTKGILTNEEKLQFRTFMDEDQSFRRKVSALAILNYIDHKENLVEEEYRDVFVEPRRSSRNTIIVLLSSLVLICGVVIVLFYISSTKRNIEEIEKIYLEEDKTIQYCDLTISQLDSLIQVSFDSSLIDTKTLYISYVEAFRQKQCTRIAQLNPKIDSMRLDHYSITLIKAECAYLSGNLIQSLSYFNDAVTSIGDIQVMNYIKWRMLLINMMLNKDAEVKELMEQLSNDDQYKFLIESRELNKYIHD
jgi:hypothetical protein